MRVKLLPTPVQAAALEATLRVSNRAANLVAKIAFEHRCFRHYDLRKLTYDQIKTAFGLAAQAAQHVIKKVSDAYRTLHANLAQPYDDRCLSWQHQERTVSIWTTGGRLKGVAFTGSAPHLALLAGHRRGKSDLAYREGMWFLHTTVEVADVPITRPDGFLGIDLGIVNIATTSTGIRHSGKHLNAARRRHRELRRRRKESRFAANVNHTIAKQIVTEAERTGRGIALEALGGIRERVRLRKPQRVTLHTWSFHQLGSFISYKAARSGVAVIHVDPAHTSQQCSRCGHVDRRNRPDQATFRCTSCGFAEHADVNAARNIASRGVAGWAVSHRCLTRPEPSRPSTTRSRKLGLLRAEKLT